MKTSDNIDDSRRAGVGLHITSLPGPNGIGELGQHARAFIDTMTQMRLSVWQFLPTGPTAYGDSPYQPLSTFAGNEMLIDIDDLIDRNLLHAVEVAELRALPENFVDYEALIPIKNRLLRLAASRFSRVANNSQQMAFNKFVSKHDASWLHEYAVFRVLKNLHEEQSWQEWPPEFANRDESALRLIEEKEADAIAQLKVVQFLFFQQWASLRSYAHENGVTLFGDLPIYIALDSADAWANGAILKIDEHGQPEGVAGVPPDYFSEDGQLWGNPLYDWSFHAANNYSWWIKRIQAALALTDLVRIDHFRGFESYWVVPFEASNARNGRWERGPGDALFDALRESLGALPIIAEDLGVITPEVEALRDRHGLTGMRVLQFDVCDAEFALSDIAENRVCYTGTHDNDTSVGWFNGSPNDLRSEDDIAHTQEMALRMTGGKAESIHTDLINAAFSTDARVAIAPLQDFLGLGSDARMNTPGVTGGNWRWRLLPEQLAPDFCHNIATMVTATGRERLNNGTE